MIVKEIFKVAAILDNPMKKLTQTENIVIKYSYVGWESIPSASYMPKSREAMEEAIKDLDENVYVKIKKSSLDSGVINISNSKFTKEDFIKALYSYHDENDESLEGEFKFE